MGVYLNSKKPAILFRADSEALYFVDKSGILEELFPLTDVPPGEALQKSGQTQKGHRYIAITRPRRFGKTVIANMIAAFFGKGMDCSDIFKSMQIASSKGFSTHLHQHNVIHIMFNEMPKECYSYRDYIERIEKRLLGDLLLEYPKAGISAGDTLWDAMNQIVEQYETKFIFVLDEWDYIFHRDFVSDKDKEAYLGFLSNLLKDQPYVELAYMTGILPIAKYSSGSELNMFYEYTMASEEKFSRYFGFLQEEVEELYQRYLRQPFAERKVTLEGLRTWYDGYDTRAGFPVYNPRSVVASLTNNNLGNYWTSSGPYDEISFYIEKNVSDIRDDLALLVSGIPITANIREYAATSMNLSTRDEILSAMVVYGFLNYKDGYVSVPNKELMEKYSDLVKKDASLGYVYRLAKESDRMLKATLAGNTIVMEKILSFAHDTESPLLMYNNETELTMIVNMIYLAARDHYKIEREDKAGIGYVDFIFYPLNKSDDGIILELKVDDTPENAVQQIKEKKYALKFSGKMGEIPEYTGGVLAVGIAYDKKTKKHRCIVEKLS